MSQNERKKVLKSIIQNSNFGFEECRIWLMNFDFKFGFITMAHYIRLIEGKDFNRDQKDELLKTAISMMDFSCYEGYFDASKSIEQLYQKIFMVMSIQFVFEYFYQQSYFVWLVLAKYYIDEHNLLSPHDPHIWDMNEETNKGKIYWFFKRRNIDLQEKLDEIKPNLFEFVMNYFKKQTF
jgi:hypothetical protein